MDQYITITNRLIENTEKRTSLIGIEPSLMAVIDQIILRTRVLSTGTTNTEIAAFRKILCDV